MSAPPSGGRLRHRPRQGLDKLLRGPFPSPEQQIVSNSAAPLNEPFAGRTAPLRIRSFKCETFQARLSSEAVCFGSPRMSLGSLSLPIIPSSLGVKDLRDLLFRPQPG